jgi:hypothetical protein
LHTVLVTPYPKFFDLVRHDLGGLGAIPRLASPCVNEGHIIIIQKHATHSMRWASQEATDLTPAGKFGIQNSSPRVWRKGDDQPQAVMLSGAGS